MHRFIRNLRYGTRALAKNRGFTAVAVVTLALGIGANTAIFTMVNAVLLRPLPYQEPEKLVYITNSYANLDASLSPPDFAEYRRHTEIFADLSVLRISDFNLTGAGPPERIEGALVSGSFFRILGVAAALGRTFSPEDDQPGAEPVVVISDGLWKRRFGADPGAVGTTILSNNRKYTVVGVAPEWFRFPEATELWTPIAFTPQQTADNQRGNQYLTVLARLAPGLTLETAQERLDVIARDVQQRFPNQYTKDSGWRLKLTSFVEATVGDTRPVLMVLLGAVGFLLLVACANLANLMLARAMRRQGELAIRRALGAGRLQLAGQLFTEALLLTAIGGGAGLLLAIWGIDALKAMEPASLPRWRELSLDRSVLSFTAGIALFSTLLFGLWPAWQASGTDLSQSLKEGRGTSAGARRQRLANFTIVAEISLTLVLLIGAGLMIRTLGRLSEVDPGFRPDRLLTMRLLLPRSTYETSRIDGFFSEVLARVRGLPGVESAGAVNALPFSGVLNSGTFHIESRPEPPGKSLPHADLRVATPGYFEAMGIPLRSGRYLADRDGSQSVDVAVIDETLAKTYWPGEDPIGRRISLGPAEMGNWMMVVGIVGQVKHQSLDGAPKGTVYLPSAQRPSRLMALVIRTSGEPISLANAVRGEVTAVDRNQPVFDVQTMEQRLAESLERRRFALVLLGLFSAIALFLAAVGIYGVTSYAVSQRIHEIGIRLALGAKPRNVLGVVAGRGVTLSLSGAVLGIVGAIALTRTLENLLYEIAPTDASTFAGAVLLVTAVASAACIAPALRALRVDPIIALRHE